MRHLTYSWITSYLILGTNCNFKDHIPFKVMITPSIHIEEFMVKKDELTLQEDNKHGFNSRKDKPKYINKN